MKSTERYYTADSAFRYHCDNCNQCKQFDGSTRSCGFLCLKGIELFDNMKTAKKAIELSARRKR